MNNETKQPADQPKDQPAPKPYTPPQIIHELELETRAGSPLGLPDPLDLSGLDE